MEGFALFGPLFTKIDGHMTTFANEMAARTADTVGPIVVSCLSLGFLAFGFLIIRGAVQAPMMEYLAKCVRTGIIVAVALTGGLYQGQISNIILTTPDQLATALVSDQSGTGTGAANLIDDAAGKGFDKADDAFKKANLFSADGFFYSLAGFIVILGTVAVVAVGGAFLLLAKIGLAVMCGLGPAFIIMLLWKPTEKFFDLWMGQVCGFAMLIVLTATCFGFMVSIFTGFVDTMSFDGAQNIAYNLGGLLILAVAIFIVLIQLPGVSSAIGGGAALSGLHELRSMANGAKGAAKGAAGAVGGAATNAGATVAGVRAMHAAHSAGASPSAARAAGRAAAGHYKSKKAA